MSSGRHRIHRVSKKNFADSLSFYGPRKKAIENHGSSLTNISTKETFYPSFTRKKENKKEREESTERTVRMSEILDLNIIIVQSEAICVGL